MNRAVPVLAVGAVFALAGCGSTNVDTGKIERQLQSRVAQQAGLQRGEVRVDCPPDEPAEKGRTFTCTLHYSGARRTVVVRLEADDTYSATIRTRTATTTTQ